MQYIRTHFLCFFYMRTYSHIPARSGRDWVQFFFVLDEADVGLGGMSTREKCFSVMSCQHCSSTEEVKSTGRTEPKSRKWAGSEQEVSSPHWGGGNTLPNKFTALPEVNGILSHSSFIQLVEPCTYGFFCGWYAEFCFAINFLTQYKEVVAKRKCQLHVKGHFKFLPISSPQVCKPMGRE